MIIAIEGIDGAGKNTLVTALRTELDAEVLSFPNYADSRYAQWASRALTGRFGDLVDSAYGMALMFALDREAALPTLERFVGTPQVLLCDRYVASNAAYSWARTGNREVATWVGELEFTELGLPVPDLQVLLATPPKVAAERARSREALNSSRMRDAYERDFLLQDRTYAAYSALAEESWYSPWVAATTSGDILDAIAQLGAP